MSPSVTHSDGIPVIVESGKDDVPQVNGVALKVLPDEYYRARLSTMAMNRTFDGSMLLV